MTDRLNRFQAAQYLDRTVWTLDWWRRENRGPRSFKIGGRVWYSKLDLDAWVQDQIAKSVRGGIQ